MKKFKFLVTNSLIRKIKTKAFIITQIITAIIILAITIIPSLIPEPKEDVLKDYNVAIINESNDDTVINSFLTSNFVLTGNLIITNLDELSANDFWGNDTYDVLINYKSPNATKVDLEDVTEVIYYSKIQGQDNNVLKALVSQTKHLLVEDINLELIFTEIDDINGGIIEPEEDEESFNPAIMAISTAYFLVIFLFIIFSTQTLGAEILEEKSTKAIETIISSVPAEKHFYSKITSSVVFTTIQLLIMAAVGLLGLIISKVILNIRNISSSIGPIKEIFAFDNIVIIIIITVIAAILGLLLYLILFAFFASFANNNEEYQKAQTPLMMVLLFIFYGSIFLAGAQQFGIIKWLTFIPFFTPFLLPISMLTGQISIWLGIVILFILIVVVVFITKIIVPAYRVSILNYSNDKLFKSVKRSFKSSRKNK